MKTHILLLAATVPLLASASVTVQLPTDSLTVFSEAQTPRVALPLSDGTFSPDSTIVMLSTQHGYEADVTVKGGGIRFYAPNTSGGETEADWPMTWYTLADFAVDPPLEHYLNPLYIAGSDFKYDYIPLPEGSYHVYFFDQTDNGQHYNLFTYYPDDQEEDTDPGFPPALYLIDMFNQGLKIPAVPDEPGMYRGKVTMPAPDFKVSFQEQGYYIPGFIFGPEDASVSSLYSYEKVPIAFGTNTWVPITYAPAAPAGYTTLKAGDDAEVEVDLSGPVNFIRVSKEGATSVDTSLPSKAEISEVWTFQGVRTAPSSHHGPAIVRLRDGSLKKVILP